MKLAQVQLDIAQEAVSRGVPGTTNLDPANHGSGFGALIGGIMSFAMAIAALLVLFYLIWGAFEWVTSAGDKGKLEKARQRIMGAITGIIVLSAVTALFILVQQFLGITVLSFPSLGIAGGGGNGGGGNNDICTITGNPVNAGGPAGYCSQGNAFVQCFGPDENYNYNHYDPCYCEDGAQYQLPGYNFGKC
ncbi:MAG: hypothetical protein H6773_04535 [Pseudomonadales bacterium]|nr:hypothetical protein [Candidatus Woesebacteria bacterium]MCB9801424.1 hypothetical protein [Pseudomonadales bacterium]